MVWSADLQSASNGGTGGLKIRAAEVGRYATLDPFQGKRSSGFRRCNARAFCQAVGAKGAFNGEIDSMRCPQAPE